MSPRKPPVLANWVLNRSGFTGQNPPLAGDLLEEFRNGRSSAWYWRQTLAVIATGVLLNARLYRRYLLAVIIGWAAETSVTFVLWWNHYPPQLPHIVGSIAHVLMLIWVLWSLWKLFRPRRPVSGLAPASEIAELPDPSGAAPGPVALACSTFMVFLMSYCAFALLWGMALLGLILIQAGWLVVGATNFLTSGEPNCL